MKKIISVILSLIIVLMMGMSALPVAATDIYPDLLESSFDADGAAFNFVTGTDLERLDPNKVPVTVYDETADAYFLRTSKDDPTNHLISKEATNPLHNMFVTLKPQDPELDLSFAWEFMVRLPEMPAAKTYGNGYWASGGFTFMADANYGYFHVAEGTNDANMKEYELRFAMEANKWYHCILIYDDFEHQFYAYVNGQRIKTADGADAVSANPFRWTYLWHWGLNIGGGNVELKRTDLSQDIAIYNIYSQIIPETDVLEIYESAAVQWGMIDKPVSTPTAKPTQAPTEVPTEVPTEIPTESATEAATQAPDATESIIESAEPADPTAAPKKDGGSNTVVVVAIVAAVVVIGGGIAAGVIFTKKKK